MKSTLDGLERAKHLGVMRVRIDAVEVRSGEKVGEIVLAAEGNGVVLHERGRMVT